MAQLRFTAPDTVTRTIARVVRIDLHPQDPGHVNIVVAIGNIVGSDFVELERKVVRVLDAPGSVQTTVTTLETQALTYLQAQGHLPAGTRE